MNSATSTSTNTQSALYEALRATLSLITYASTDDRAFHGDNRIEWDEIRPRAEAAIKAHEAEMVELPAPPAEIAIESAAPSNRRSASELLVRAYALGESRGGSTDWEDLNLAYEVACTELGVEKVAAIEAEMEAIVAAEDGADEGEEEEDSDSDA